MDDKPNVSELEQSIRQSSDKRTKDRSIRRSLATNSVQTARDQGGRGTEPWSTTDSDVVFAITELLDRVADSA